MDVLNKTELEQLMLNEQQNCVSIYLPTHQTGAEIQQDPIRLKNQLKEAEILLSAQGVSTRGMQTMLEPQARYCRILAFGSIRAMVWRFFSLQTEFASFVSH